MTDGSFPYIAVKAYFLRVDRGGSETEMDVPDDAVPGVEL